MQFFTTVIQRLVDFVSVYLVYVNPLIAILKQPTHQRPVYQLIRCGIIIANGV